MKSRIPALLAMAALVVACSDSSSGGGDEDTSVRDGGDDVAETGTDDIEADESSDVPEVSDDAEDTTPDAEQDAVEDTNVGPDVPFDCEVVGDECSSSSIFCADDEEAVAFCSRCGQVLRTEPCDGTDVCEEIDGAARCRPCEGDECPEIDDSECEPNQRGCLDYNSVQICGPDGYVDSVADCASGRRCFEGSCGSAGSTTGETCSKNIDPVTGCNGHGCICGEEFTSTEAGAAQCGAGSPLAEGYCTTVDCSANRCDYDDEVCVAFGISGMLDGGSYCVLNEGCEVRGRSCGTRPGFECMQMPGRRRADAPVIWEWGCWMDVATIGEACDSDTDCLGGECRTRNVAGSRVSYCTMPCGADASCPSHAACVADPEDDGEFVCLANANSDACPRLDTEPLRIGSTPPLARYGAGRQSVCYFAQ